MALATLATIVGIITTIFQLYIYVVIAAVIVSWLIAFGVINMRNEFVRTAVRFLDALTEPVFRQIRRVIPPIGGLDLSPLIVVLVLSAINVYFFPILLERLSQGNYL
jgi:YggT family protein